jgi:hypothetical protein
MCTYIFSNDLAVIPLATEENVAIVIHGVSGSNHAVDVQWPPEFRLLDFDGVDLQGACCPCILDGFVCGEHGTQRRCISKQSTFVLDHQKPESFFVKRMTGLYSLV